MHSAQFPYSVSEWTTLCAVGYDFSFFYRVSSFEWTSHWYFSSMNRCHRELSRGNYGGCRWRRKTVSGGVGKHNSKHARSCACTRTTSHAHRHTHALTHEGTHPLHVSVFAQTALLGPSLSHPLMRPKRLIVVWSKWYK